MKKKSLLRLINLPKISDDCLLYFAQNPDTVPFEIKRVYFITTPKPNLPRGAHAHRQTEQILFCIQGKCRLTFDDGKYKEEITLTSPEIGVHLPPLLWHEMHDLNEDTILLVLASKVYLASDYIRDYGEFKKISNSKK